MKLVDDEGIEIAELNRINLHENDVLVVKITKQSHIPPESLIHIKNNLDTMFPNNKSLIVCEGAELEIINGGRNNEQRD